MKIIGFNFTKVNVEKESNDFKDLKIESNVDIESVEEAKSDIISKESLIEVRFRYVISYSPNIAKVDLKGILLLMVDSKEFKSFMKSWKDKEIFPSEYKVMLFNVILKKSNIKALQLEDEMGLPLHIPLPTVKDIKK
ncbi:MAG TPA: hypothetical protein VJZ93_00880 [Candidatus Nanoarchaeia archaeon]|nr:hypothetical protein [Candidatus Nanoarchaeia archaeon]